jgi:dipeptidyl aminopeptidase/acylaminoacyl peptidase
MLSCWSSRIAKLVFLVTIVAVAASAQSAAPLISRDLLFGAPEKLSPQISPDGTHLAYLAPVDGVMNIWVRTLGKNDDRAVSSESGRPIPDYLWQFDGKHLLYSQDAGGNEQYHIYQVDVATFSTKDLTPLKAKVDIAAYEPEFPDTVMLTANQRDPRVRDVYRLDLKTGKLELDTQNPGDVGEWAADHQLKVRAALAISPDGGVIIRVRDDERAPWRELVKWGPDETTILIGFVPTMMFTPDNRGLWVVTSLDADTARLVEYDIATGRRKVIVEDPQFDVAYHYILRNPRTHKLEAVGIDRERVDWKIIDPQVSAAFEAMHKASPGDITLVSLASPISRSLDDKKWVFAVVSDDAPERWYLLDRTTGECTLLFSTQPKLETAKLAKMEPVQFTARDGMKIYGYLTKPPDAKGPVPLVLFVHGGPWGRDDWGYTPYAQWLANRGYAALLINFRGSTGYGKRYLNAGDRQWAGTMRTDLLDGVQWAVEKQIADPKRVCIMGMSYGGYATLVGLAFSPDAYTCGVEWVGPSNLNTLLQTIPPWWTTLLVLFRKRMGDTEEFLTSQSPLFKADKIKAPLMIGQGANDPRVKQAESDQIVSAVRNNGKDVEYYVFPDEGHGFARPQNEKAFMAAAERFLGKYLGGRVEPPTAEESSLLEKVKH